MGVLNPARRPPLGLEVPVHEVRHDPAVLEGHGVVVRADHEVRVDRARTEGQGQPARSVEAPAHEALGQRHGRPGREAVVLHQEVLGLGLPDRHPRVRVRQRLVQELDVREPPVEDLEFPLARLLGDVQVPPRPAPVQVVLRVGRPVRADPVHVVDHGRVREPEAALGEVFELDRAEIQEGVQVPPLVHAQGIMNEGARGGREHQGPVLHSARVLGRDELDVARVGLAILGVLRGVIEQADPVLRLVIANGRRADLNSAALLDHRRVTRPGGRP